MPHHRFLVGPLALACLISGLVADGKAVRASAERNETWLDIIDARDLKWRDVPAPDGAKRATDYPGHTALVRWPAGAMIPFFARTAGWHGVTLRGELVIMVAGRPERHLGPLTYFALWPNTAFSVRCEGPTPCLYLTFDENDETHTEREVLSSPVRVGTADESPSMPTGVTRPHDLRLDFLDLDAGEWRPVPGLPGVLQPVADEIPLRGRLNAYYVYRLAQGATAPPTHSFAAHAFVLRGGLELRPEGEQSQRLGPGSYYRKVGDTPYTARCVDEACVILTADLPSGGALARDPSSLEGASEPRSSQPPRREGGAAAGAAGRAGTRAGDLGLLEGTGGYRERAPD